MLKKVLRVNDQFGAERGGNGQANVLSCFDGVQQEKCCIDIFKKHGWHIKRGGKPDHSNPRELGFFNYGNMGGVLPYEVIAERADLLTPRRLKKKDILSTEIPIVVKGVYADSGEDKYLLKTKEQKLRFLTWLMMGHHLKKLCLNANMDSVIHFLKRSILNGNDDNIWFQNSSLEDLFYFEEYIESLSDYYTSYRIIVDGKRHIHHGYLVYSKERKGVGVMDHRRYLEYSDDPKNWTDPNLRLEIFLLHPSSPLFIASEKFVSNVSQGEGERVLLDGKKNVHPHIRELLKAHQIDPDHSKIPKVLFNQAKTVGFICKNMFPFVGIDFLQNKKGKFYFLEANAAPWLNAKYFGLPEETPWFQTTIWLLEKIAQS